MAKVSRHTLNHILAQNLRMIYNLRRGSLEEFSDGAHLHFSVEENGVLINPLTYLELEEK